jgi:integrase
MTTSKGGRPATGSESESTDATPKRARRKSANGAGSVERRGALWWLQVLRPLEPGETNRRRGRIPIEGSEKMTEAQARRAAVKLAADFRNGKIVFGVSRGAKPVPVGPAGDWRTVRQLGEAWTGTPDKRGRVTTTPMLERFGRVNKLRVKAGATIDRWTLEANAYDVKTRGDAGPAFGDLDVAAVTSDDIAKVMGAQPADNRAETRIKQYNRLHRLFELAEFPCRLRQEGSNPVKKYLRPEPDADKLFCFLYPSELLALLHGRNAAGEIAVALVRRVLYALATFTGQRKGSLFAMRWKHVDFAHGTLASFKTKTGRAQYFVADRGLMALLKAWHLHQGEPDADEPIVPSSIEALGCEPKRLATALRDDLHAVRVTRAILFEENEPNVEPLRFHDLRSTFCTWARREGKSDAWISERTGQEVTGDMINRYDRGAQTLADLAYAPFPDITDAVPELVETRAPLPQTLPQEPPAPAGTVDVLPAIPLAYVVGAIGIEPTTPTVSR